MLSWFRLESNMVIFTDSCLSVAYIIMLLKGVMPIPPDKNTAVFEQSSCRTNFPSGAVIFTEVPTSKLESFFLNGASLMLVIFLWYSILDFFHMNPDKPEAILQQKTHVALSVVGTERLLSCLNASGYFGFRYAKYLAKLSFVVTSYISKWLSSSLSL